MKNNIVKDYFDRSLLSNFRNTINSSNVFELPKYKHYLTLISVLMDRLESAINYLNSHIEKPTNEEGLILFMVYASMLKDGIYKVYENIYHKKPQTINEKKYFISAHRYSKKIFTTETSPTDDVFFEYFRALTFAHPFGVDKRSGRNFMDSSETHYSPWVITNCLFDKENDSIGLRIYTNKDESIQNIFISFKRLKEYLLDRYNLLNFFNEWSNKEIINQNDLWKQQKVNRSGNTIDVLQSISSILEQRFIQHDTIDLAIKIFQCNFKDKINMDALNIVKGKIELNLNKLCDRVDNLNHDEIGETIDFLYNRPFNLHKDAHYELEKIFNYLDDEGRGPGLYGSNEEFGFIQAKNFYNTYAKNFVYIDFEKMKHLEIKILIRISLILGFEKENKK